MEKIDNNSDFNICVGIITAVNGVKGYVKIKSFTENPDDLTKFQQVFDEDNISYRISLVSQKRDYMIAGIEGVDNRNKAEKLRNKKLYIKRSELPDASEDEYYHADLVDLEARTEDGTKFGTVRDIVNFGAGDIIEVHDAALDRSVFYPFTKQFVPEINIKEGYVAFGVLEEVLAAEEDK